MKRLGLVLASIGLGLSCSFCKKEENETVDAPGYAVVYSCNLSSLDGAKESDTQKVTFTWYEPTATTSPVQRVLVSDERYERSPSAIIVVLDKAKKRTDVPDAVTVTAQVILSGPDLCTLRISIEQGTGRRVIWTGTYLHQPPASLPNGQRGAVLAWAPSDAFGYPAELAFVQHIAQRLQQADVTLRVYGIKPERQPEMAALWQGKVPGHVRLALMPPMPYADFVVSLAEVAVGLQPVCEDHAYSLGKSFGKALAYLAADAAIVASNNIDHPLFFKDRANSRLLANDAAAWADACDDLLGHADHRQALVNQARLDFLARLTTTRSAALLSELLHRTRRGQPWPRGLAASAIPAPP